MKTKLIRLGMVAAAFGLAATRPATAEPLVPHPAVAGAAGAAWNTQLGQHGESMVREVLRAGGHEVFDLNMGAKGIDALARIPGVDGRVEFRVVEVKTLQAGTDFALGETADGPQLSERWTERRLTRAAAEHPDPKARAAAAEALEQFRRKPGAIRAELHGLSVGDNRYVVKAVDPSTGAVRAELSSTRASDVLKNLGERAGSKEVRDAAARHLAGFDQLRAARKPEVVAGEALARHFAETAGVEERQAAAALTEASEHVRAPGQTRWVRVGGKAARFVGKAAGPAGVAVGVVVYTAEAADIEQRIERGELTREQGDAEQAKLGVRTTTAVSGGVGGMFAGMAVGTMLCPGLGTVAGGIIGAVGGSVGAELVMAATGLTDAVGEYLSPGVETVRRAAGYIKDKGVEVAVATREQVREWVGPEAYDDTVAALSTAGAWAGEKSSQAATAVKDSAVYVKDQVVGAAEATGQAATEAASWTWGTTKSGWRFMRRQFE